VGLPRSIGIGKGTVTLEDFDHCDAIFSFGHNPGTNHPRMMTTLHEAARRGCPIVVFNPLRERSLERFASPQDPIEMVTLSSTRIGSQYLQVKVGGDVAALKGLMKALLAMERDALAENREGIFDLAFIAEHCIDYDEFVADLGRTSWSSIIQSSGLAKAALEDAADVYAKAKSVIITYGMGITQHRTGTANVRYLMNLLLLRGNIGRKGAGICPLRGHSNVQGNRTVGISERPQPAFLASFEKVFGFAPPSKHGHSVVETIEAMRDGRSKVLISLGGNFAQAAPDPEVTHAALRKLDLFVGITTKLNRSNLLFGCDALILPCLGRTERDEQASGVQSITVEDSMSQVHASTGLNEPAGPAIRSEVAIVAGMAKALLGNHPVDWDACVADYDVIRDYIEKVFPIFHDYNARIRVPGGFRLPVGASDRIWNTASGKASFYTFLGTEEDRVFADRTVLRLTTLRSHDQYNTTIYGLDDRYRGIFGRRDVLLMNASDMRDQGLVAGMRVRVDSAVSEKFIEGWTVVEYDIPPGSCGAYYPEANGLVVLEDRDPDCLTPAYKSAPVHVSAAA
jgi:molybdopterin-dependent oxidoreductase alpha subunit